MSKFGMERVGRSLRGGTAAPADDVDPAEGNAMLKWLGLGGAVLATSILAGLAVATLSLRECVLLAAVTILALTVEYRYLPIYER